MQYLPLRSLLQSLPAYPRVTAEQQQDSLLLRASPAATCQLTPSYHQPLHMKSFLLPGHCFHKCSQTHRVCQITHFDACGAFSYHLTLLVHLIKYQECKRHEKPAIAELDYHHLDHPALYRNRQPAQRAAGGCLTLLQLL